jgi:hypothetical protein
MGGDGAFRRPQGGTAWAERVTEEESGGRGGAQPAGVRNSAGRCSARWSAKLGGEMADVNDVVVAEQERPFDGVAKLPDVTGP